jgi:hypothetical protein
MLDPGTSTAMTAPRRITHDAASAEDRRHELWNATIATVGEDAPVQLTQRLDLRTTVVDCIVAIARTAGGSRDDLEITMTHQHLCVAGVTVVLRLRRMRMIPCRNQRAVDDPRAAPVTAGDVVEEYGEPSSAARHRLSGVRRSVTSSVASSIVGQPFACGKASTSTSAAWYRTDEPAVPRSTIGGVGIERL